MDFSPFDLHCRAVLDAMPKRHSRQSLRSALHHLERAAVLVDVDPAMAAFRALTAEEEAATGLMHCLKEKGYSNANLLKPKEHVQKNAISPFLDVLGMSFAQTIGIQFGAPRLVLDGEGDLRRLMLVLPVNLNGEETWAKPIPPLNFTVTINGKTPLYRAEIERLVEAKGRKSIVEYLKMQANQRNLLLYAGPEGYPGEVTVPDGFYDARRGRVLALLRAYLLIQPYEDKMTFVQDSLDAFLAMVGALKHTDLPEFM